MKSIFRKTLIPIFFVLILTTLSGCYDNQNNRELTEYEQTMIDTIWENKTTWQDVKAGFDHFQCNTIEFGEYLGKTVFISRWVGEKKPIYCCYGLS